MTGAEGPSGTREEFEQPIGRQENPLETQRDAIRQRIETFFRENCEHGYDFMSMVEDFEVQDDGTVIMLNSIRVKKPYDPDGETIPPEIVEATTIACDEEINTFVASNLKNAGQLHLHSRVVKLPRLITVRGDLCLERAESVIAPSLFKIGGSTDLSSLDIARSCFGRLYFFANSIKIRIPVGTFLGFNATAFPDESHSGTVRPRPYTVRLSEKTGERNRDWEERERIREWLNRNGVGDVSDAAISLGENISSTERGISPIDETNKDGGQEEPPQT